jgi:hypothetical protein
METETLAIGAKAVQIEAAEDKGMVEVRDVKIGDKVCAVIHIFSLQTCCSCI